MKTYYFIGRLLRPFAVVSLIVYSYVLRVPRARVVLENEDGELLFVKSWLSGGAWGLPGGGANRHEDAASAASRELREETGIVLAKNRLQPLMTLRSRGHDEVVFFASAQKSDLPAELPNRFEIQDIGWFPVAELPHLEPLCQRIVGGMAHRR